MLSETNNAEEVADFRSAALGEDKEKTLRAVVRWMKDGKVFVERRRGKIVAMLLLTRRKPWAIDVSYFTPMKAPLYLLAMAVAPALQRKGIGRRCLADAEKIATAWPADAIRLDAYDRETGAGGFYERCGYREVGRVVYRGTPLIYFERLVGEG